MSDIRRGRVYENCTGTGTGALTLTGAVATGYKRFQDVMTNGQTCVATIVDASSGAWETSQCTWNTGNTITRSVWKDGSTATFIDFAAGTKQVFISVAATELATIADCLAAIVSGTITGALGFTPANKAGDTIAGTLAMSGAAFNEAVSVTVASATTPAIFAAASNSITMSGTTTVTGFDTIAAGVRRIIKHTGAHLLTHNATSLILLGGASFTTASGDFSEWLSLGSGNTVMTRYQRAAGRNLTTGVTDTLAIGFTVASYSLGTMGSFTINPALGNSQYGTNGGAFTLTAPTSDCAIDLLSTNNGSAGSITFSGFTVGTGTGDALTTTNTNKFLIMIRRINSVSTYYIKALQ